MDNSENYFLGPLLDRLAHLRGDVEGLHARLENSLIVPVYREMNLIGGREAPEAVFFSYAEAKFWLRAAPEPIFLGSDGGQDFFAVDISDFDEEMIGHEMFTGRGDWYDLRRVTPLLFEREGGVLAYARGMTYWLRRHRYCGTCGAPTTARKAGFEVQCSDERCGAIQYPRIDPAIITLVVRGERCVLGRSRHFPRGMYSTLAGFVEPGESLEEALRREVFEEVGLGIGRIRYYGSQPWPFPASVMLGFIAEAETEEINLEMDDELEDAQWYDREWLQNLPPDNRDFHPPRAGSIARAMLEAWLAEKV
jgi:NAD+ diphosphatase